MELTLRDVDAEKLQILAPAGDPLPGCETCGEGETVKIVLSNAGLYTVLVFG